MDVRIPHTGCPATHYVNVGSPIVPSQVVGCILDVVVRVGYVVTG